MNLQVTVTEKNNEKNIKLQGSIDEFSKFPEITDNDKNNIVSVDLKGIIRINSLGIRLWILWMESMKPCQQVILKNCPQLIVNQMNSISGFKPDYVNVLSFYINYYCEECDLQNNVLLHSDNSFKKTGSQAEESVIPPQLKQCSNCKNETKLDVNIQNYFKFLEKKSNG